ncbi:hypothetical protein A2U01_0023561 [Trifolium medium]|uniref:Uncharacterized protein n=1 Tax=Trifolium medium TaxID=97028 RepID=A0A392NRM2_9FABA|nr:hypothetical protein [Trifolium medium]
MMESVEKADVKRLTLTPHYEPEEVVVLQAFEKSLQEGMMLFEQEEKAEEEKKKAEEEEERQRDAEKKEAEAMVIEFGDQEGTSQNKGKDVMDSEPPSYILKMQADIESQRINHEALQQKVDKIAANQEDISSKLSDLIALMSKKP